ncbi:SH2 domain-containing adapter protein D [Oryzias melastigma]|uniref:SH2 domain-containing adapter protein D n=1 Tax=Oryzias melastigma TaxID=30732 RepID=A0A834BV18_ORYME|nr:SH2 domain-containing adapter protein D [Oryzias melastigma]
MAKWLKDHLNFGSRRDPPQPPRPDYTESEIVKAYRAQKALDFEDPYQHSDKEHQNGRSLCPSSIRQRHRLLLIHSMLDRTRGSDKTGSRKPHQQTVVATWNRSRPSELFQGLKSNVKNKFHTLQCATANGTLFPAELQHSVMTNMSVSGDGSQLYDNPYEEKRGHQRGAAPQEKSLSREADLSPLDSRESRLPQDDERPADEYDQPWEWKKDNISKALAGQTEQSRLTKTAAASTATPEPATLRLCSDTPAVLGERVDPFLPLEKQVWYHGALMPVGGRISADFVQGELLSEKEDSSVISSSRFRSCNGFMHMKFTRTADGRYVLGENSPPFSSIPEVIHHYTTHKLPIRGAEHMSLMYPVIVQTL